MPIISTDRDDGAVTLTVVPVRAVQAVHRVLGWPLAFLRLEALGERAVTWWLKRHGLVAMSEDQVVTAFDLGHRIGYRDGRRGVGPLAELDWSAWCDSALAVTRTAPVVPGQRVLRAVGGHR